MDEAKKTSEALEKELREKVKAILTPEQQEQMKKAHEEMHKHKAEVNSTLSVPRRFYSGGILSHEGRSLRGDRSSGISCSVGNPSLGDSGRCSRAMLRSLSGTTAKRKSDISTLLDIDRRN